MLSEKDAGKVGSGVGKPRHGAGQHKQENPVGLIHAVAPVKTHVEQSAKGRKGGRKDNRKPTRKHDLLHFDRFMMKYHIGKIEYYVCKTHHKNIALKGA